MLPPGFEPEYTAREAVMIGRTTLREHIEELSSRGYFNNR